MSHIFPRINLPFPELTLPNGALRGRKYTTRSVRCLLVWEMPHSKDILCSLLRNGNCSMGEVMFRDVARCCFLPSSCVRMRRSCGCAWLRDGVHVDVACHDVPCSEQRKCNRDATQPKERTKENGVTWNYSYSFHCVPLVCRHKFRLLVNLNNNSVVVPLLPRVGMYMCLVGLLEEASI